MSCDEEDTIFENGFVESNINSGTVKRQKETILRVQK